MQQVWADDLDVLLDTMPPRVALALRNRQTEQNILEIVMDLGRLPEARYPRGQEEFLSDEEVTQSDLDYVESRVGSFNDDNRAGIERTLHRISAIRNRQGRIIGVTCRVGRAIFGTMSIIRDLVESNSSILLVGRPGVGKTTMLREIARVLADDLRRRVVVVDTSNEIAGDGDIPHSAIGHARRMQVPSPNLQHRVMIEAVENHMPQVIIIDEIGTELEAAATRTIAERGVQLVGTAHGNTLENLIMNPTLSDLVGGIQSVTLGDREARRRRTQKSVLERKAPPTFDVLVEIQSWDQVAVHADVARTVDSLLRGSAPRPTIRHISATGHIEETESEPVPISPNLAIDNIPLAPEGPDRPERSERSERPAVTLTDLFPYGVSRNDLEQGIRSRSLPIRLVDRIEQADVLVTTKQQFRKRARTLNDAQASGLPVYVLRNNSRSQIDQALADISGRGDQSEPVGDAMEETENAVKQILDGEQEIELSPQDPWVRRLQHQLATRYNIGSNSTGREPNRHVRLFQREE